MRAFTLRNRVSCGPLRLVALAAVALLAACSTTPDYPPAPRSAATPDYNYIIGPLDNVNIIVWRNPELSMSVPVRPDGKVTFPLVEDLPALGKDPTTLARDVEKALGKYIRDPIVTIIVTNFVAAVSNRSWPSAIPNTAAVSAPFAGSSSARSVGSISFVASGSAANAELTFTKRS
jgi:polysaccharide export outer membrane protein